VTAPYPTELVPEEDELSRALEGRFGDVRPIGGSVAWGAPAGLNSSQGTRVPFGPDRMGSRLPKAAALGRDYSWLSVTALVRRARGRLEPWLRVPVLPR
jgi:hypothetical protein